MQPALVTTKPKPPVQHAPDGRCMQCGEKLPTHPSSEVPPPARTDLEICNDCSVHDLPHTD
jgi:hypothetical protein